MPWARIDDNFYDHRKIVRLLDEPDGLAAVGLWTLCLAWARKQHKRGDTQALIPHGVPRRLSGCDPSLPSLLTKAGLWTDCADGWLIHDYDQYLPSQATSEARAEAGRKGGIKSGQSRVSAGAASKVLQESSMGFEANEAKGQARHGLGKEELTETSDYLRPDVERLCSHLADAIEANGSKRPPVGQAWRDACRLMLDKDGRSVDQVAKAIIWCQNDEFWRGVVLSMPKLRQQYDKLRLAAQRSAGPKQATTDARVQEALSLLDT